MEMERDRNSARTPRRSTTPGEKAERICGPHVIGAVHAFRIGTAPTSSLGARLRCAYFKGRAAGTEPLNLFLPRNRAAPSF